MTASCAAGIRHLSVACTALLGLGLAGPAAAAPTAGFPPYVDLVDYPSEYAQWSTFHDLRRRLADDFNGVCGDTYCEGEFSDIQALRLRCAVRYDTGTVSHCRWAFAASELAVDTGSGEIQARQPVWLCRLPVPEGTTVAGFFAALAGPRPLFQTLPGATASFHEVLAECLN